MKKYLITLTLFALPIILIAQQRLDLSGEWKVSLEGIGNKTIILPNTLDGAGIGELNALGPSLTKPQLSRLTRKHSFIGQATYQREITITKEMADKPLELLLERVMWRSRLLIDGKDCGQMQESLVSPHVYNIKGLSEGKHTLTLIIDNNKLHEISVDNLAHSYTNDTQIMWNGVLGRMELSVAQTMSDVQVYPDVEKSFIKVKVKAENSAFLLDGVQVSATRTADGEYLIPISNMKLWNEFTPNLYQLTVMAGKQQKTVSFGMRSFKAKGNRLLINGKPTFLRGTLECCIFPLKGIYYCPRVWTEPSAFPLLVSTRGCIPCSR